MLFPTTDEYFPLSQLVQVLIEVAPDTEENFPTTQFTQLVDAVT